MLFTTMGDKSKPAVLFFHAMGVTGASSEPVAKCLYWSKGGTLKKIMWCDDEAIKPYFIAAGKALTCAARWRTALRTSPSLPCRKICSGTPGLSLAALRSI